MQQQSRRSTHHRESPATYLGESPLESRAGKTTKITASVPAPTIGVALLGMGVVGSGVVRVLYEKHRRLLAMAGRPISLKGALVRDLAKRRHVGAPPEFLTTDAEAIIDNPEVDIVVEVMGGRQPALDYILKSISLGKHVVTANKEVMARHAQEILALATEKGVQVLFEASVAAGTPIVAPLIRDLAANSVSSIRGIINGTTNFILTKMAQEREDFEAALRKAQELGYAEADPASDVEGADSAYKLAILSSLAWGTRVTDTDVYREGIARLKACDFVYAGELGYTIKLLATAKKQDGFLQLRVHPALMPSNTLLARVDGVHNAAEIETDLAGRVSFHGHGAGALSTASAIVAGIIDISHSIVGDGRPPKPPKLEGNAKIRPMSELETKYYLRLTVADRPGVLAQIAKVLGDLRISIDSVLQKGTDDDGHRAELVLTTHRAKEASVQRALRQLTDLEVVHEVGNMIRVEEM